MVHSLTPEQMDELGLMVIPLEGLLEYCDPMLDDVWGCGKIEEKDVRSCTGYALEPAEEASEAFGSYAHNVSRIAYFLEHGWEDPATDSNPVSVDIGLEGYTPYEMIVDGNHRVAAAKLRGDKTITVSVIGDWGKAEAVFLRGEHADDYAG